MSPMIVRTLVAACLIAIPALVPDPARAEETALATVNGKAITESDIAFADQEVGAELASVPTDLKRRYLLEYLIETELMADAGEAANLASGPEWEKRLEYVKRRAKREAYFEKTVRGEVNEAAARTLYDQQIKLMKPEEEVQARHILVKTEAEAKALAEKIAGGADFAALAKEVSIDSGSKEDGGNLGFFSKGQMVPQFEEAAFALKKGEVSKPVQSQFGWHLIKLEDRRAKPPPPFDQVKAQIMVSLIKQKAEDSLGKLRGDAKIEYLDPGIKRLMEEDKKAQDPIEAQMEQMREQMEKSKAGEQK